MTLDQLRIFIQVAEREHLTQAADVLALTPSAVSSSIKSLENQYGTVLFNRVGRRIELTEAGRIFLTEAKSTLNSARAAELTLKELGSMKRGTLNIHASQTIASYWLPPILVRFHQKHPQISINLIVGNTQQVAQSVHDGTADLGYVEGRVDDTLLNVCTVYEDQVVVVVAPEHPWGNGALINPTELVKADWIMREPGSGTRAVLENILALVGVEISNLNVALTLPSNEAVRSAVISGQFATLVSKFVVDAHIKAGLLRIVNIALPHREFYSLTHKARYKTKASLAFEEVVRLQVIME
ncbi:LysR substrate-binding domain-containing protein [Solimicrobium silvestre]|uniref:Transcriptional regulator n=1 Tax=Solimicrobium silvestre TaxID=2099400 RepID=A0A2S9H0D1_9BURK|nr:LysR substrate-binding domain-containing protein [Solimicrobium silvestre]PRC93413.1 Transcriptional regulator [Solimicrobium silvestre]